MTTTRRLRLSPEQRRAQLVELGVEMLTMHRLDELSVELIASAAGISRGLLFHYFASKHEFHVEVARAAAAEMIRRTTPDPSLPAGEALHASLSAFIDYVQENPDNYTAFVRGSASGDAELREIFDDTRAALAQRILDVVGALGLRLSATAELAVHGWVAYAEECVIRWLGQPEISHDRLLALLADSLTALVLAAGSDAAVLADALTAGA